MTKTVKIGRVVVGGGNKIAVQSMANIKTEYVDKVVSPEYDEISEDIVYKSYYFHYDGGKR